MIRIGADAVILLVEDSPDDQLAFRLACREAGFDNPIHVVENGADALAWLRGQAPYEDRSQHPVPSVVFLDINMPRLGGIEMLRRLRKDDSIPDVPVVVTTVSDADRDIIQAFQLGSLFYVRKPISSDNLRALLA